MFNQRPNSLVGLEPRCNDLMNLLSPIIYSPDEYFRNYLNQFSVPDMAAVHQHNLATSPLIQRPIVPKEPVVEVERPRSLALSSATCPSERNNDSNSVPQDRTVTDEERLRKKRERNRRAAANCRRRKDEKLKQLEEENEKLRKTIKSLQESLRMVQENGTY